MRIGELRFERGIFLAPMEDVSDRPFRRVCRRLGADMVTTEFVSSEALIRKVARSHGKIRLADDEHPVGIQLYGNREEALVEAARVSERAGPDVIDINFGCPVKKVACKGAGSGLLREPELLLRLTEAVVRAVSLPVTVKTRLGWDDSSIVIVDLAKRLEDVGVAALTLHARTRKQMFKGEAAWEWIGRVKQAVSIPVIGNGDVRTPADVARMFETTGCDAVMIGRAAIGNPWIFPRAKAYLRTGIDPGPPERAEQVAVFMEQLREAVREKEERKAVLEMRKHLSAILRGEPNISEVRAEALQQTSVEGVRDVLARYLAGREPVGVCG
ncbi:MAG: tRNA dihydrouridine synthase DusB [Candidatus Eisenbacteria bacterium]|nr:tRNA dihydrouridine synthase DusB [Candidatus Latescibacterota bacterium]MBD3303106.1 tRNA dihydrouridine synthase DusB [Candidatus Eisenbacteria bacterium]